MNTPTTTTIVPINGGKWSATTQTPVGPMTAVGDSIEEAKMALDRLLAIARAIEVTRHHTFSADHSHLKPSGGRDMRVVGRSEHEHR